MTLLIIFIVLNIVNVILQTAKSIATVKCGKTVAALVNALAYGLYTVVIIYTNADLPLWEKVAVVAVTNLIGVFVVKLIEEKMTKDKLWKIDATFLTMDFEKVKKILYDAEIPFSYQMYGKHTMFAIYCQTQKESHIVSEIVKMYNGKYFISENRGLLY